MSRGSPLTWILFLTNGGFLLLAALFTYESIREREHKATKIVKGWAKHLGADLVGICKIDHRWAYSQKGEVHYGEWEEWGKASEMTPFTVNAQRSSGQA